MLESHHSDGDLPERLGQRLPVKASDKKDIPNQSGESNTVAALQYEVITLRDQAKEVKKNAVKTDAIISSLHKSVETPNAVAEGVSIIDDSNQDGENGLVASFTSATKSIPMATQDGLSLSAASNPPQLESFASTDMPKPEAESFNPPKSVLKNTYEFGTQIAFQMPDINPATVSENIQIASASPDVSKSDSFLTTPARAKFSPVTSIAKAPEPSIAKDLNAGKAAPESIAAKPPTSSSPVDSILTRNDLPNVVASAQDLGTGKTERKSFTSNYDQSSSPSTPTIALDKSFNQNTIAQAISPQSGIQGNQLAEQRSIEQKSTEQRSIANNQTPVSKPTTEQIASVQDKPQYQPSDKTPADATTSKSQELAKPMQIAQNVGAKQNSIERPNLVASNTAAEYSQPLREANLRDTGRDFAKEAKETQIAAVNYPKYGGAPPVEESSKPVIQQQKPQSFQSSLARDSAAEKAHPLSESFVSGRVLPNESKSVENKGTDNKTADSKGITSDNKAVDSRTADSKSADIKYADSKISDSKLSDSKSVDSKAISAKAGDSKISDFKSTEARLVEGRPSDQRSLDTASERILAAAIPGQPIKPADFQPQVKPDVGGKGDQGAKADLGSKSDSSTKADSVHIDSQAQDKSGKKQDSDDKKEQSQAGKGPGSHADTSKIPGSKAFNDLLDFIDKADQGDIKPGGKVNNPPAGSSILSPDDVLITGTGAIGQIGIPTEKDEGAGEDETADDDKLSHRRKKYIVQPDDTLESIAKNELGDSRFSSLILTINQANISSKIVDGKKIALRLEPGQIIWLPSDHELQVHAEIYLLDNA